MTVGTEQYKAQQITQFNFPTTYNKAVSWGSGWFCKAMLSAVAITQEQSTTPPGATSWSTRLALTPTNTVRYNPSTDDGKGNIVFLKSTLNSSWDRPLDYKLYIKDHPLWLSLWDG